jgi:hypothetical protein
MSSSAKTESRRVEASDLTDAMAVRTQENA